MLPPGPRAPAFWQTYQAVKHPRAYTRAMRVRYGDAVRFHLLNGRGVAFASPELAREVFATDPDSFEVEQGIMGLFGDRALLATSGPAHRRQRKLLNPRFHGARVKGFLETIQRSVLGSLEVLEAACTAGETIRVLDVAQVITQNVILEAVFGADAGLDRPSARALLSGFVRAVVPSLMGAANLHSSLYPPWRAFQRQRAAFDAWVDAILEARRNRGDLGTDVLGTLLEARYEDGSAIADGEIRDQLMTLLFAGYETTATAIAWGIHWLLREPTTLAKLRAEVDALGSTASVERLVKLPYLEAVTSEALRVEPIVTYVSRVCRVPVQIGPWTVPAGEIASVNLLGILGDEKIFSDPERFRPERFLERTFTAAEFLPFGGGQRRCLGAAFAEAELAIALATIASDWELAPAHSAPERAVRRNLTMGPARGVPVRVLERRRRA
jgi:cytochrome P450